MEHPNGTFPSEIVPIVECGLLAALVLFASLRKSRPVAWPGPLLSATARWFRSDFRLIASAGLAAVLGCALLGVFLGTPIRGNQDASAYLIMGETFASGKLANPPAPHLSLVPEQSLATPVYTGKYPPGQGLMLAIGFALGDPYIALLISAGLLAATLTWCLLGWLPRRWALLGAVVVLLRLAVGSYWNHSYWGGSVAAIGGALVFGGLGRHLGSATYSADLRNLLAASLGLSILAITRPFEGFLVSLPVLAWLLLWWVRRVRNNHGAGLRAGLILALVGGSTVAWMGYYNFRTTGSPTVFAHQRYEEDRPVAGEFVWQRWIQSSRRMSWVDVDVPAEERSGWWWQSTRYFFHRLMKAAFFLIGPSLTLSLILGLPTLCRRRRHLWLLLCCLLVAVGHSIVHFHFPHYSAPMLAPLLILGLTALRSLYLRPPSWFRYSPILLSATVLIEIISFTIQIPGLRHDPQGTVSRQAAVTRQLGERGGDHLILVAPGKASVYNFRDLNAPVLWAADLGEDSTSSLLELFPERELWIFDPYAEPALSPLSRENASALGGPQPR